MNPSSLQALLACGDRSDAIGETTLQCSELGPVIPLASCLELDRALHQAEIACRSQRPNIATIHVRGHQVGIGLGLPESFVSIQSCGAAPGPCYLAISEPPADHEAVFYFLGGRRAEIPRRNLLLASKARVIVREFYKTGERSPSVNWQEL